MPLYQHRLRQEYPAAPFPHHRFDYASGQNMKLIAIKKICNFQLLQSKTNNMIIIIIIIIVSILIL